MCGWRTPVRRTGFKTRLRPLEVRTEGALECTAAAGETADFVSDLSLGFLLSGDSRRTIMIKQRYSAGGWDATVTRQLRLLKAPGYLQGLSP